MTKMYNQVYGKFSTASGVWLKNKSYKNSKENIFTDEIIETYETKVLQDLMRMNLEKKIKDMSVMDVGSGRHSLALERLGAKKIDLVDISKANYVRMKKFISKNKTIIKNFNNDICSSSFKIWKRKYDLIYLDGVIQHTKSPAIALNNLCDKLDKNGIIYLYFYQFGNPLNIHRDIARKIFLKKKIKITESISFFKNKYKPKIVDSIIDNLGCDYCHILPSSYYLDLMKSLGFKMYWSKDIYNRKPSIRISRRSCLSAFRKTQKKNLKNFNYLRRKMSFDLYDFKNYHKEDEKLIKNINKLKYILINLVEKKISKKKSLEIINLFISQILTENLLDNYKMKSKNLEKTFKKAILMLSMKKNNNY